jgi:uncharacterized cupin superfamily protein
VSFVPDEARLEQVGNGLAPVSDGWFVVNAREAAWSDHETFGRSCGFELSGVIARAAGREPIHFEQLGINLKVIEPGQPSTLYHSESNQEAFLVLSGECLLTIEGEQRRLGKWDFVHCPLGTKHSLTGVGEEPCVFVAVGARRERDWRYFPTPLAESVETEISGAEAYAPYGHRTIAATKPDL